MTFRDSVYLRAPLLLRRACRVLAVVLAVAVLVRCTDSTAPSNPTPTLNGADPGSAIAGTAGATVTLTGNGFVSASRARWNGAERPTTLVSATSLTVQLTAQDLASAGSGTLAVYNAPPGGGTSGALTFEIYPAVPPPNIERFLPAKAYVGTQLTLLVLGSAFTSTSVVLWNGTARPTTVAGATALFAQIPASDVAVAGTASITVRNSEPGSGTSASVSFPIVPVPAATHPSGTFYVATLVAGRPYGVAIAPSGRLYISLIDGNAVRRATVDPNSFTLSSTVAVGLQPANVALDPQGLRAYTANQAGQSVSVVDAESNTLLQTIPLTEPALNVLVSPTENRLYVSTEGGHLLVFNTETLQQVASIPVGLAANGIALDAVSQRVYVSSIQGATVTAIDLSTNSVVRTHTVGGSPQRIVLSPDRQELYIASETAGLEILDLAAGTRTSASNVSPGAVGLALSPDGEQLYVTNPSAGLVQMVNRATRQVVNTFRNVGRPRNVAFESHGTVAVVTDENGRVLFIR